MQIQTLLDDWDNISENKKLAAFTALTAIVIQRAIDNDFSSMEEFIKDVLWAAADLAPDDYFGTEGLDV